jgi:hypothetical protein
MMIVACAGCWEIGGLDQQVSAGTVAVFREDDAVEGIVCPAGSGRRLGGWARRRGVAGWATAVAGTTLSAARTTTMTRQPVTLIHFAKST